MNALRAVDVFTPSDYPTVTYVDRDEEGLERRLRDALSTPGEVVSVSGPSKSGKTVLIERVVGLDQLISITGAGIKTPEHLWERVLDWMGAPHQETGQSSRGTGAEIGGTVGGSVGIPGIGGGRTELRSAISSTRSTSQGTASGRRGMAQVIEETANSDFVLLLDDFHYMDRTIQTEVAKQIKDAARRGVKICTASVPHRADDVVRGNPELRGRVRAVDLDYWKSDDLKRIAAQGFEALGLTVNQDAVDVFCTESSGSPQLMQAICLQSCFELDVREKVEEGCECTLDDRDVRQVLQETSTRTDFSFLVRAMHNGPKTRGTERKEFDYYDTTRGDVYRCLLLAMSQDPPYLSYPYNSLSRRISQVCNSDTPQAASVYQACSQLAKIDEEMNPTARVLEWDESESLLDIIDPYFLFFLRWSGKIASLARVP